MSDVDMNLITLAHPLPSEGTVVFPFECHDALTRVVYIELPESQLALVQAAFDLAEGLGVIRTVTSTPNNSGVTNIAIITTISQGEACGRALFEVLGPPVAWPAFGDSAQDPVASEHSALRSGGWRILDPRLPEVRKAAERGLVAE